MASTSSEINNKSFKKIDPYGNIINYDENAWVGEDNQETSYNEIDTIETIPQSSNAGVLSISITEKINIDERTNILVSLVDEYYNMHDIYVYYRNDYKEMVELPEGVYKVSLVKNLGSSTQALIPSASQFKIVKGQTTNIVLDSQNIKKATSNYITTSTTSYIQTEKKKGSIIFSIVIWIVILAVIYFAFKKIVIKYLKNKEE